jgi:hypothetical protein
VSPGASVDLPPSEPPQHRARAVVGFVAGLALFGAAVWTIATGDHGFEEAWDAARNAPWWIVGAVLLLPVLNWLLISECFRALTGRYARLGRVEMSGLIASAWLLNYLPMKPGMFGRLAYHKHVNGVRYADSARVLGFSVSLTGLSLGLLIAAEILMRLGGPPWLWVALPAGVLAGAALLLRGRGPWTGRVAYAATLRYLDSLVIVARYAAAFVLIGEPLSFADAVLVGIIAQLAFLVPIGNGLGVREWAVRLATMPVGLLADVVNRAAETVVLAPIGIAGTVWSVREVRRRRAGRPASAPPRGGE